MNQEVHNKKIYILLTFSGTVLSKIIKVMTDEPYSHVSVSLDSGLDELYSFGRKNPRNPIFAGFVKEDIINGTYARFPNTKCALYSLEIDNYQYESLKRELNKFKFSQKRYKYNLIGLIGVVIGYPIDREYNYFCSQFVAKVLKNSKIELLDKEIGLIEPKDFRICEELELIYEGDLQQYKSLNTIF